MTIAPPVCRFRACRAVLGPFSVALYCSPAHRSAEHRAVRADRALEGAQRKAQALALVGDIGVATMLGDEARVLELVVEIEDLLAP